MYVCRCPTPIIGVEEKEKGNRVPLLSYCLAEKNKQLEISSFKINKNIYVTNALINGQSSALFMKSYFIQSSLNTNFDDSLLGRMP